MKSLIKTFAAIVVTTLATHSLAAPQEAPPREPPYTDSNEFDSVLGEDPAASNQPVPVSPAPSNNSGSSQSALDDWSNTPATPAPAKTQKPKEKKVSKGYASAAEDSVDTTPQKGVKLIHHPDAKKGLIRIEQDGTYVYKIKTTPKDETGTLRFGLMDPPRITAADGVTTFETMYGSGPVPTLMFDYEWQPFSKYGKLGVQAGVDFSMSSGHGHFLDGGEALEKYTFIVIPMNLGLIYRLEYFKRQWVAPYIAGGGSLIGIAELRDDDKNNLSNTWAAYAAGGIMFNLTAIDKSMAFNLDSEYGVGNLWLVAEYRYLKSFSDFLDFNGGIMSVGISADF